MRRFHLFTLISAVIILVVSAIGASAQSGQLRGHVLFKQADGTTVKAAGAQVDVYRTDMPGNWTLKADKNGEFVHAGLPFVGTYIVSASMPNAAPRVQRNVKVGRDVDYEVVLSPGDGHRLTLDEINKMGSGTGSSGGSGSGGGGESAAEKAKREEAMKKYAEEKTKVENINKVVGDAFKDGNAALTAKNYDEAIKQYNTGLAADPEQAALLTNKAVALRMRGVDKYNAAIQSKDDAAKTAGLDAAKEDFKAAAEAGTKAVELAKKQPVATDPNELKQQTLNKYFALSARAEAMRLFVTKADPTQADAALTAFEEYIAAETDPAKKSKAQLDAAQMLLDSGSGDKAYAEFRKILAAQPDDPDANLGAGLALFSTGDKAKYQDAANYLQRFVDKAPETHKFKADAKAILAELKSTENVVPERTTRPTRKRP